MPRKKDLVSNINIITYSIISSFIFLIFFVLFKEMFKFGFHGNIFDTNKLKSEILSKYKEKIYNLYLDKKEILNQENILAKSFLIYDLTNKKIIYAKKENEKMPLASLTKLMTAYTAINSCNYKDVGILNKMLIASDNDSASKIESECQKKINFIEKMNINAKENGLNMSFVNSTGLDIKKETEASNYGDAVSTIKLIDIFYKNNSNVLLNTTFNTYKGIKNTNEIAQNTPFLIGSKTGYTDISGGNLLTIYEIGTERRFAIVVLGSTKEGRFKDTELLRDYYLKNI